MSTNFLECPLCPLFPRGRRQLITPFHICKWSFLIHWEQFKWFLPPWEESKKDDLSRYYLSLLLLLTNLIFLTLHKEIDLLFTFLSPCLEFSSSILLQPTPHLSDSFITLLKSQHLWGPSLTLHIALTSPCFLYNVRIAHFWLSAPLTWELREGRDCVWFTPVSLGTSSVSST